MASMKNTLMLAIFLVACGDNKSVPDANSGRTPVFLPPGHLGPDKPGSECANYDINTNCPDPYQDAAVADVDAFVEEDVELKAACCHALLDGQPPKFECGYPPGLCKNGKKILFCKNELGEDAMFELCNP